MAKEYTNSVDKDATSQIKEQINVITSLLNNFEEDDNFKSTEILLSEINTYAEMIEKISIQEGFIEISSLSADIIVKLNGVLKSHNSKYIVIEISNYINNVGIFLDRMLEEVVLVVSDEVFEVSHEMKSLFLEETKEHLKEINKILFKLENDKKNSKKLLDEFYREIHSIKGDTNALGYYRATDLAHNIESEVSVLQKSNQQPNQGFIDYLFESIDILSKIIETIISDEYDNDVIKESKQEQLENQFSEKIEEENNTYDYIPEEIKNLYGEETKEHITNISRFLLDLENDNSSKSDLLESIYRELHSIKGDSNALGLINVGEKAHEMETIISSIQKGEKNISSNIIDLLFDKARQLQKLFSKSTGYKFNDEDELNINTNIIQETKEIEIEYDNVEIPEEIKALYGEEAKEHIINISKCLLDIEDESSDKKDLLQNIYRELHSIKGDSNALGLMKIGNTAHKMESVINALQKEELALNTQIIENLFNLLEIMRLGIVKSTSVVIDSFKFVPDFDSKSSEIEEEIIKSVTHNEPEESYDDIPDDIKEIYIAETTEHLIKVSKIVLDIEENNDMGLLNELYREFHSIKGDSNALGFIKIGELSHNLESIITDCQKNNKVSKNSLDNLHSGLEQINNIFDKIVGNRKAKFTTTLVINKEDVRKTSIMSKDAIIDSSPLSERDKLAKIFETKKILEESLKVTSEKTKTNSVNKTTGENKKSVSTQSDETIRVSTNKIDKIINLSDELLISKIGYDQRLSEIKDVMETISDYKINIKNIFKYLVVDNNSEQISKTLEDLQNNLSHFEEKLNSNFKELKKDNYRFSLLVDEIQSDSRNTRMLTASYLIEPLKIVVRNTAKKLNKLVTLHIAGEGIEIDRLIIEKLKDPLGHIIRNSLDHGIESPDERKIKGKLEQAKLIIDVKISGNNIVFKISDDGRGINYSKIASKAVRLGMITEDQAETISDFELNKIMFSSGFSTADKITDVSGRGVGLDVVKSTIESINGNISVVSVMGEGTSFILSVPLTLTTFDAILISLGNNKYALPKQSVVSTMNIHVSKIISNGDNKAILIENQPIKLVDLALLVDEKTNSDSRSEITIAVIESGAGKVAFIVDDFIESRKMVMKNLGSQLLRVPNISGATIMGDGEPVLVLNTSEIVSSVYSETMNYSISDNSVSEDNKSTKREKIRILVVDDSITTRTLEKNILENAGYEVVIGKNGLEGKEGVEKYLPDLIITDVEMPKMNGYQFASWVKKESPYSNIPVIMITSLATPEFKMKGLESGVNAYIVKGEFNQTKLLDTINQLLYIN